MKQNRDRENLYRKNRVVMIGMGEAPIERCRLPGFEDMEAQANAEHQQFAEDRKNGVVSGSSGITVEDVERANQRLIEEGPVSREELYARNEITFVTPLGVFKHNLLPSPERFEEICREVMREMRLKDRPESP